MFDFNYLYFVIKLTIIIHVIINFLICINLIIYLIYLFYAHKFKFLVIIHKVRLIVIQFIFIFNQYMYFHILLLIFNNLSYFILIIHC